MARDDAAFSEYVEMRSAALFRTAYLLTGDHALEPQLGRVGHVCFTRRPAQVGTSDCACRALRNGRSERRSATVA